VRTFCIVVAAALVVSACSTESTPEPTSPTAVGSTIVSTTTTAAPAPLRAVIVDLSPTVSDFGALAFLAAHPGVYLIGVTLAGTGQTGCEPGVEMTRGVLDFLGLPGVPVACGQPDPIDGQNAFAADQRMTQSDLGVELGVSSEERSASQLIGDLIKSSPVQVDFVALGPLTNLAVAFAVDPTLPGFLESITVSGGAIDVAGNAPNDVAEWNFWVDPVAASDVLRAGVPVTLVPLDASQHVPTSSAFLDALDANSVTSAARLVRDIWVRNGAWATNEENLFFFWDELAVAALVNPEIARFMTRNLIVDLEVDSAGRTRADAEGIPIRVVASVDRLAFERLVLETLTGLAVSPDY
jgi:inosine-uridine nucleoside N-ribohydrolase